MLLALANQLNVLPVELNKLLIIVVVLSMALTPALAELGKVLAARAVAGDPDGEGGCREGGRGWCGGGGRPGCRGTSHAVYLTCSVQPLVWGASMHEPRRRAQRGRASLLCCASKGYNMTHAASCVPPPAPPHTPTPSCAPAALYSSEGYNMEEPVVICGFGGVGQTVANMLASPALGRSLPYVAFDNNVARVQVGGAGAPACIKVLGGGEERGGSCCPGRAPRRLCRWCRWPTRTVLSFTLLWCPTPPVLQAAQEAGFNVLYGDGSRTKVCGVVWWGRRSSRGAPPGQRRCLLPLACACCRVGRRFGHRGNPEVPTASTPRRPCSLSQVLHAAGIERPKAIAVGYTARQRAVTAVEALHEAYPGVPIYVRALDMQHAAALKEAGV